MALTRAHIIPIGAFGYQHSCSPRVPSVKVAKQLAAHLIRDGFITMTEPIIALPPDAENLDGIPVPSWDEAVARKPALNGFQLRYIKGFTRICTLYALIHMIWEDGVQLEDVSSKLFSSCQRIVVYIMQVTTAQK